MNARKHSNHGDIESSIPTVNEIVYATEDAVLFSQLVDGKFEKKWRHWTQQYVEVRKDKTLVYKQTKHSTATRVLDISTVKLTYIPLGDTKSKKDENDANESLLGADIGLHVECMEGHLPTAFKCVMPAYEVEAFCSLLQEIIEPGHHNVDEFIRELSSNRGDSLRGSLLGHTGVDENGLPIPRPSLRNRNTSTSNTGYYKLHHSRSVMRRSIAQAIDAHTYKTRIDKIISRRGAFKWLPVAFSNDLVHGSWWYVIGSFFGVIFPIFVIIGNHNSHVQQFRNDDDLLFEFTYDATWILMIVSGVFFTLGSIAFLRAVNDPPMKPLVENSYHFGTDELLGSWFFVFATLPMVPYSIIYIFATPKEWVVYFLLVVALCSVAGAFLFLFNCYPSEDDRPAYILPLIRALNCGHLFCSERLMAKHLQNDWLAGTWIIMWLTVMATVVTTYMFVRGIQTRIPLKIFIDGCTFLDCIMFLIGSVYFVAGSYPADDDDDDSASTQTNDIGRGSASSKTRNPGHESATESNSAGAGGGGASPNADDHIDRVLSTLEQAVMQNRDGVNDSESQDFGESLCLLPGDSDAASVRTEVTTYTLPGAAHNV